MELVERLRQPGPVSAWRRDVLQARKDRWICAAIIWNGFAAQIRSVQEYYDRSMQLLDPAIRAELFVPERPIRAKAADKSSAYYRPRRLLRELPGGGRLQHRGRGGELHPLPRRGGGGRALRCATACCSRRRWCAGARRVSLC